MAVNTHKKEVFEFSALVVIMFGEIMYSFSTGHNISTAPTNCSTKNFDNNQTLF